MCSSDLSNGWLDGWKKSYGVKERKTHGEAGSAPILEVEEEMQQIRAELMKYDIADVWNADETAYYWRMQPGVSPQACLGRLQVTSTETDPRLVETANFDTYSAQI